MLLPSLAILAGFALLIWGADRFILGAAAIARNLGVAPLLIGLTVVGFGTSAPEVLVAGTAALQGNPGLAIGNAIGSNIANIGLILGATALVTPLLVHSDTVRREYPLLMVVSFASLLLMVDGDLSRVDGLILLAGLAVTLFILVRIGLARKANDPLLAEFDAEIPVGMPMGKALFWFLVGLAVLIGSSKLLVWGAVITAQHFGVSDLVIGLTIVAIGTSLPELAAAIASTLKGEHDLAIGNVVGSNIYNLLAVLSLPGLLAPSALPPEVLNRDIPTMLALTTLPLAILLINRRQMINRIEGALLLLAFIAYQGWIYLDAVGGKTA